MKICFIRTKDDHQLTSLLRSAQMEKVMAIDFEGDLRGDGVMSLMQVAFGGGNKAFILDLYTCPDLLRRSELAKTLENPNIVKVLHDCRNDARALRGQFNISLVNAFDTQVGHYMLSNKDQTQKQVGMNAVLKAYAGENNTLKASVKHKRGLWEQRPLPSLLLDYSAQDVKHLVAVYHAMKRRSKPEQLACIKTLSTEKASPPLSAKVLLRETCAAFENHFRATNANTNGDPVTLLKLFDEWKSAELAAGRKWKGGSKKVVSRTAAKLAQKAKKTMSRTKAEGKVSIQEAVKRVEGSRSAIEADKGGLRVSHIAQDGVVPVGGSSVQRLTVQNTGKVVRVLNSVKLLRADTAPFFTVSCALPLSIAPSQSVTIELRCAPARAGILCNMLVFSFVTFTIARSVEMRCGDASLLDDLKPASPYCRPKKQPRQPLPAEVVPAPSIPAGGAHLELPVPMYAFPKRFQHQIDLGETTQILEEDFAAIQSSDRKVAVKHYGRFWQNLLWSEELQLTRDLASFNLTGDSATVLSKRGAAELELHVAGLAEKRPSVVRGDRVRVRLAGKPGKAWEGLATYIHREEVGLKFHASFHKLYQPDQRVDVEFVLPRMPHRICHQGAELARQLPADVLFPVLPLRIREPRVDAFLPINASIASNPAQRAAVLSILQGASRPVPYILFGPPGTGKTTTLVEAIIQSLRCKAMPSEVKVLVCAPTNTAADVICERLAADLGPHRSLDSTELLRLMGYSRSESQVPELVRRFTNKDAEGSFAMPSLQELESRRVVVSTLALAGKLHNVGMKRGHFDIIFVDEAGQAVEPEAVAPVASLLGLDGQLVLAGDVKQLGPVIHSSLAKQAGLQTSLMERLMQREVYGKDLALHPDTLGFDKRVLTKLEWNFRSHPSLLELPNELFYDGELKSKADPQVVNNCLAWDGLEAAGIPIIFEGVEGKDDREANSPSWFNADEACSVLQYVEALMRARIPLRVQQSDIGVITPYNKQVHKIQKLLRQECYGDIQVGSTEMFQGSEKRVIIISTVRSSRDFITWDKKHQLGFLDNPKRFNVAITRAACLLIVIGNPMVLAGDPCWGALLRLCARHKVYRGVQLPDLDGAASTADANGNSQQQTELLAVLEEMLQGDEGASDMIVQEAASMPEHDV